MMILSVLFIGILFFLIFYFIGSYFLFVSLKQETDFLQHLINFWIGLLLVTSFYALIRTNGVTILFLIPLVLLSFRTELSKLSVGSSLSSWKFVLGVVGMYIFIFFLQVNFSLDVFENPNSYMSALHPKAGERIIYSTILSLVHYNSIETISPENVIHGFTGVSIYHFIEFWLGSLFKFIYNAKSDIVLLYFIYPLFKTFFVLTVFAVFADKIKFKNSKYIIISIILCFIVFGFRWMFVPVFKSELRELLLVPMLVLVSKAIYIRKYNAALAILMVASVENVLYLPALGIFFLCFLGKFKGKQVGALLAFIIGYILFLFFFKENINNKYFPFKVITILETNFKNLKLVSKIVISGLFFYPIKVLVSYFIFENYKDLKGESIKVNLSYYLLICYFGYFFSYAIMDHLSIDAMQLRKMAFYFAFVSFFFLLYELVVRDQKIIVILLLLLTGSDGYPFAKIEKDPYGNGLDMKLQRLAKGKVLKGLFVDEKRTLGSRFYLGSYPTYATQYARANDYRTYLFNYDINGFLTSIPNKEVSVQPILYKSIQPLFPLDTPILENIKNYGISIVWISKKSKYLSAFSGKMPLHELEEYYVYYFADSPRR